jgi:pimeloyl-ACP methyl ester carboxylesterase
MRTILIVFAALATATAQQGRGGRGPATPPPQLTAEQRAQYQSKIGEIDAFLTQFRAKKVDSDLIADVEIYSKAGKWLLEFPQGFANAQNISTFLGVLDQGLERARLLKDGKSPWVQEKGRKVLGYYSQLDGSVQPMGVTIPESYQPSTPSRLYVWLHGRNNTLTEASFINGIKNVPQFPNTAYTADVGQLTLDCYGRGNNANHQAGEVDIFEGIEAMRRRFKIDDNRIILRGFSLGGAGAWHIALQYPDRWAAAEIGAGTYPGRLMYAQTPFPPHQHGPLHIYENIIDWALNATNFPLAAHDGDNDTQVATVGAGRGAAPTPNRGQLESSLRVKAQLAKEGHPNTGLFLISEKTGHGVNREVRDKLDTYLKEHGDKGRQVPDHIRFVTWTTRYNQCFWVNVDGLEKHYERAEIDAERANGQYKISTKNLTRLTLRDTSKATSIQIDGQELKVKSAKEIVLEKMPTGWKVARPGRWAGLHKTHGLQGPIDDAFLQPFLLVKPTQMPWNAEAHKHAMRMLERFDRLWAMNYRAHPRIKDDTDVTAADFAKYNVVLFGDPGSNRWIGKIAGRLPIKWTKESIAVGDKTFAAGDHVPVLAYPNPLNPSKYIVLNSGVTISDQDYNADYAMPRFGDIAVLKTKEVAEPPEIVWAALFDEGWRLR